ncbi:hypothetical protein E4U21_002760 [Claviceps maximensis]|nr:hypothetical protein E4U21_002760 [Claviceps maximensis]
MTPIALHSVLHHHHLYARDESSPGIVSLYIILGAVIALVVSCVLQWGFAQNHRFYSFRHRRRRAATPSDSCSTSRFQHGDRRGRRRRGATPGGPVPLDSLDPETGDVTRPGNVHLR